MAGVASARPFIRPYNPHADFGDTIHVFRETCDASLKIEPLWTIGSFLWCRPYLFLRPRTCFVLDDGNGRVVGYILGASDTDRFCEDWTAQYLPAVEQELAALLSTSTECSADERALESRCTSLLNTAHDAHDAVYSQFAGFLKLWPGHLHIDILPSHQRQGYGKDLLKTLLDAMKEEGCGGVYLGMTASNDGAGRFYARNGFRRLPHVLDDGTSGEMGRTVTRSDGGATIYLVSDL